MKRRTFLTSIVAAVVGARATPTHDALEFKPLGMIPNDSQFLEARKYQEAESVRTVNTIHFTYEQDASGDYVTRYRLS